MRTILLVLLSIVVLFGSLLSGAAAWSAFLGPMKEKISKMSEIVASAEEMAKTAGKQEATRSADSHVLLKIARQGLLGYRVTQWGGLAIALIDIALLVLVFMRRAKATYGVAVLGATIGLLCYVLTPARDLDKALFFVNSAIASSVVLAAVCAALCVRRGSRGASAAPR